MSAPAQAPPVSTATRVVTVAAVLLVASVAAVVSYAHMQHVAHRAGEAWRSYLLPLSVDGLIVAASMVLLARRRAGLPGGALAWTALLGGVAASLAANVAAAEPTATARVVAAWPAVAFAVAFELLLQQRRPAVTGPAAAAPESPADRRLAEGPTNGADTTTAAPNPLPRMSPAPPAPTPAVGLGERVGELDALAAHTRELAARNGGRPPGRRVLARELGCTEHRARVLLDALSPNGPAPAAGGGSR